MTQTELGDQIGGRFQQVQKYESAANRISASRLVNITKTLDVKCPCCSGSITGRKTPPRQDEGVGCGECCPVVYVVGYGSKVVYPQDNEHDAERGRVKVCVVWAGGLEPPRA